MKKGGLRAEWLVGCSHCGVDVEPGRRYDTRAAAREVLHRAVKYESWLLIKGRLLCPECAALSQKHTVT